MRTLNTIANDIRDRLFSKEIIAFFVERTDDFLAFCNMIGKTFAPYIQQFEKLNDVYNNADLLNKYLISKGLITDGHETDLPTLQDLAKNSIAILRSRGTLKHKLELGRLFTVDTSDTNLFEHQILNYDKTGWDLRINSPCYKDVFSNTLNLCYMRLEELYMVNAKNYNVNRTTEQIVDILKQKFFPLHINSHYEKKNSFLTISEPTIKRLHHHSFMEIFQGKYNEKFHLRIKIKNLHSPTDSITDVIDFLTMTDNSGIGIYFTLFFDSSDNKIYYQNYNTTNIFSSNELLGFCGKFNKTSVLDFFYDESLTKKVTILLDGKEIIYDTDDLNFSLLETNACLLVGVANYSSGDFQYDLLSLEIENDLFGKLVYEDFNTSLMEVNAEGKFGNENFKYFIKN